MKLVCAECGETGRVLKVLYDEAAQVHQDIARHGRSSLVSDVIEIRG